MNDSTATLAAALIFVLMCALFVLAQRADRREEERLGALDLVGMLMLELTAAPEVTISLEALEAWYAGGLSVKVEQDAVNGEHRVRVLLDGAA